MNSFKNKYLNEGPYPYFIAEIGINHNGYYDLAKRMIDKSKEAGADAVKFQHFLANKIVSDFGFKKLGK